MTLKDTITRLFGLPAPAGSDASAEVPAEDLEAKPSQDTAAGSEANAGSDATASPDAPNAGAEAPPAEREV